MTETTQEERDAIRYTEARHLMPNRVLERLCEDADRLQHAEELPERWRKYAKEMRELGGPVKEAEAHKCEAIAAELEATLGGHHDD